MTKLLKWRSDQWLHGIKDRVGDKRMVVAIKGRDVNLPCEGHVLYPDCIVVDVRVVIMCCRFGRCFHWDHQGRGNMRSLYNVFPNSTGRCNFLESKRIHNYKYLTIYSYNFLVSYYVILQWYLWSCRMIFTVSLASRSLASKYRIYSCDSHLQWCWVNFYNSCLFWFLKADVIFLIKDMLLISVTLLS